MQPVAARWLASNMAMATLLAMSFPALAQPYPARPIRLVIGQAPGGHSDVIGRIIAQRLTEVLKQPVAVENRGGAGGTIGAEAVARAPADGYTLLFAASSNLGLATAVMKDLRYSPLDFAPIGSIARVSYGMVVRSKLPVATIADLVRYARAHPGELNYGSSGVASMSSLLFELLKRAANIDIVHIPYKGSGVAVTEIAGGRIDMMFTDLAGLMPQVSNGSLRLIAVSGLKRNSVAPEVLTVTEQGYPDLAIEPWYGLVAPVGTPADIIAKLSDALTEAVRTPEVRQRFDRLGFVPLESTPEQLGVVIRTEIKTFEELIERTRINPQQ